MPRRNSCASWRLAATSWPQPEAAAEAAHPLQTVFGKAKTCRWIALLPEMPFTV